jgi:dTDP-4-amino-4,6-dideoxygalactose transaminase
MINVTKPYLPPIEDYNSYMEGIWKRGWLTNNGPLVNELELRLKNYLDVNHFIYLNNGTIAIQIAIKALELKGEIITTPFSYVATTSSIVWEGCEPVFIDIDPITFNIDPTKIEEAITPTTSAILATHVYGNPCNVELIDEIANRHNLKVIYDAAHCFGVKYKGKSIYEYGDISTASFHATKIFHTIEGGGVFTRNADLLKRMSYMRNFGHDGPEKFNGVGINGKNSEFHAAMGLAVLNHMEEILLKRKELFLHYNQKLLGLKVERPEIAHNVDYNYSYYPIVFKDEDALIKANKILNDNWIYPRRYFFPCLNKLDYVQNNHNPVAEYVSKRVLCLPLYHDLSYEEIDFIARLLLRAQNN